MHNPEDDWPENGKSEQEKWLSEDSIQQESFSSVDVTAGLAAAFGSSDRRDDSTGRIPSPYAPDAIIAQQYRLIERIGEGGMGIVWFAEQLRPVKRKVAIKLIKPGIDSQSVLARFEMERQALALMDHPNIAKVFDGGITELGHPFFVMELVRGTSITTWCDQNKIDLRGRLELMIPVCQAIHHSHQKGVIHRDIKPSNVMVAMYDGKPVPKVIDFGVAKAFGATLSENSLHTAFGAVMGTAEYMSPEQAELNNLDIDTRSDVYSLGVLLYELLAGSTPFTRAELAQRGWQEALRLIRDVDPPVPSARLSTSKMRASIAAVRSIDPGQLGRLLKSELDWVVMKSLDKDRTRRYESASALLGDLQRYLSDEPVEACPPSVVYRTRKIVRRYRWQMLTVALFFGTLIAGLIGTSWGLVRAEHQRKLAELSRSEALDRAEGERLAKQEAQRQQKLAQDAESATLLAYRESTDDVIEKLIGSKEQVGPQELSYLENAKRRWQAFADQNSDDERSRALRAEGNFHLGRIWQFLGDKSKSLHAFESAVSQREALAKDFPNKLSYSNDCSVARRFLAQDLQEQGGHSQAERELSEAIRCYESMFANAKGETLYLVNLAKCYDSLGNLYETIGRPDGPEQNRKGLRIFEGLAEEFPADEGYRFQVARLQCNLANMLAEAGNVAEAEQLLRSSITVSLSLTRDSSTSPEYLYNLADRYWSLGRFLRAKLAKPGEAVEYLQQASEIYKELSLQFPSAPTYRQEQASVCIDLGQILTQQGRFSDAENNLNKAKNNLERLSVDFPDVSSYKASLGAVYLYMGELHRSRGEYAKSLEWFSKSVDIIKPISVLNGPTSAANRTLDYSLIGRANSLAALKQDTPKDWELVLENMSDQGPQQFLIQRSAILLRAEKADQAISEMDRLIESAMLERTEPAWSLVEWFDSACFFSIASMKIPDKSEQYAKRAVELLTRAIGAGFTDIEHLKRDSDLDPLRERVDFKELLDSLSKSPTK